MGGGGKGGDGGMDWAKGQNFQPQEKVKADVSMSSNVTPQRLGPLVC